VRDSTRAEACARARVQFWRALKNTVTGWWLAAARSSGFWNAVAAEASDESIRHQKPLFRFSSSTTFVQVLGSVIFTV